MNRLEDYARVFDGIHPWSGTVPDGYFVDYLGTLIDAKFLAPFGISPDYGGQYVTMPFPSIEKGEEWFEVVNWIVAAREARELYTMISLGAAYGAQVVGSQRALALVNPMPYKLVAVEAEPENHEWMRRHLRTNGIDPDRQWLIQAAMSNDNAPVLFPVAGPGLGAANCVSTNESKARKIYADELVARGHTDETLRNLLIHNTTGLKHKLVQDRAWEGEVKFVSAVTLKDVLGPFDFVDFLEADMQQSEIVVFPPAVAALKRKVRRVHIGTHGADVHRELHRMFEEHGWEIVFSYEPGGTYRERLGTFTVNDGVLTVRNPGL